MTVIVPNPPRPAQSGHIVPRCVSYTPKPHGPDLALDNNTRLRARSN